MSENSFTNEPINDSLCTIAGQCAVELINEEANAALESVDWAALNDINMDDWFEKAILRQRKAIEPPSILRRIMLYAASFFMFVVITSALISTYEPARAVFIRYIVERFPQYSEYFIQPDKGGENIGISYTEPSYIPVGFILIQSMDAPEMRFMSWGDESEEHFISYSQTIGESSVMVDTEHATIRQAMIDDMAVEIIEKGKVTTIQFFQGDVCYMLISDIAFSECVQIVKSIPIP